MPPGFQTVRAELVATVLQVSTAVGERIDTSDMLLLLDSMKMEIPVHAESAGTVSELLVTVGDVVREGDALAVVAVRAAG